MLEKMTIGCRDFILEKGPYIMGILNVTPDSFSDGGNYTNIEQALKYTKQMIDEGADIIDVGGESTRPGYTQISVQEEIERTCFVIEAIKENFDIPISLDTYKSEVAKAGILAGADMINDIWGLKWDENMATVIAKAGVSCCVMHNRPDTSYNNFLSDIIDDLRTSIDIAVGQGIKKDKIIIDPGIGFAKDTKQNLILMNNLEKLNALDCPVLLATSRKSMIGNTLNLPVEEREEGTLATSVLGLIKGCTFFRVHNVKANIRALKMADAILKSDL